MAELMAFSIGSEGIEYMAMMKAGVLQANMNRIVPYGSTDAESFKSFRKILSIIKFTMHMEKQRRE